MDAEGEFTDIEHFFGQYVHDKEKLVAKVTEALALHHKEVEADISTIKGDFVSGDFKGSGRISADLLLLILGPIE